MKSAMGDALRKPKKQSSQSAPPPTPAQMIIEFRFSYFDRLNSRRAFALHLDSGGSRRRSCVVIKSPRYSFAGPKGATLDSVPEMRLASSTGLAVQYAYGGWVFDQISRAYEANSSVR